MGKKCEGFVKTKRRWIKKNLGSAALKHFEGYAILEED
jgi:hypothetical protein